MSVDLTLGDDNLLTLDPIFLDLVLIVDPINESWVIKSSKYSNSSLRNANNTSYNDILELPYYLNLKTHSLH